MCMIYLYVCAHDRVNEFFQKKEKPWKSGSGHLYVCAHDRVNDFFQKKEKPWKSGSGRRIYIYSRLPLRKL